MILLAIQRTTRAEAGVGVFGMEDGSISTAEMPTWMAGKSWDQNYERPNYVSTRSVTTFVPNPERPKPGRPEWVQQTRVSLPQTEKRLVFELFPHQPEGQPVLWAHWEPISRTWWVDDTTPGYDFPHKLMPNEPAV